LIANEYPDQEQRSCHRGLPWWVGGDLNLAFGLGFNVLVNVLVLTTLCVGVVQIPQSTVFGIILPALGIQLLIGKRVLHLPGPLARPPGEPQRRVCDAVWPERAAHVHRDLRDHVADLPEHTDPIRAWIAGLAWSASSGSSS